MAGLTVFVLLLVAGVVLMLVLNILIVLWVVRRRHGFVLRLRSASRAEGRAEGLSDGELGELPCQDFKAAAGGTSGGECAVCLEAFQVSDRCRVLPRCRHGFHAQCVDSWLRKSRLCPVCRAEVADRGKAAGALADEAATSEIVPERSGGADPLVNCSAETLCR